MRKLLFISVLVNLLLFGHSYAVEKKVVESVNEYGGQTVTTYYTAEDNEYKLKKKTEYLDKTGTKRKVIGCRLINEYNKLKIEKAIELYSSKGVLQSVEIRICQEKAWELGYYRVVTFFDSDGLKTKKEVFYNESDFDAKIYQKSVDYYSVSGEKIRSEFYLTDREAKKTGYHKLVTYFSRGKMVKQELHDKQGIIF